MRKGKYISLFRAFLLVGFVTGYGSGGGRAIAQDITAPTVRSTKPANAATGVFINSSVSATFFEAMDPATITAATFTLKTGVTPVFGVVTYTGITATFSPAGNLTPGLFYTATIKGGATGAKDLAGNPVVGNAPGPGGDFTWSFTTGVLARQAPVDLRSCATFIALAATTVTSTGGGVYNGNVGLWPGTEVVGFPPATVPLPYAIHINDAAAIQAQADLLLAYQDAEGRSLAPITLSGNQGGKTLTPGLYKSTSTLAISSGDLTLDAQGDPNGVFIFQIASGFDMTSDRKIVLSGGAKAANIFWQVGSSATFGTTSVIKGTVLALTSVTMLAGATLEGRALALNAAVTLNNANFSGNVGIPNPVDNTPPSVSFTVPANGSVGVANNANLTATFSEPMDPATISGATFTLQQGNTPVPGVVTYSGTTATFDPTANLTGDTTYTAIITTGARDVDGNALENDFAWTFTTGTTPDTTPPTVSSTVPADGDVDVSLDGNLTATFSEAMDPATLNTVTFTLKQGATAVAGAVTYAGTTATFNPTANLAPNVPFTATITTGVKDLAGNALATTYTWSFTTAAAPGTPVDIGAGGGQLRLVSLPEVVPSFSPFAGLLDLNRNSFLARWNPTKAMDTTYGKYQYLVSGGMPQADLAFGAAEAGVGYWHKSANVYHGVFTQRTASFDLPVLGGADPWAHWNLIGVPHTTAVNFASLQVVYGGMTRSLTEAADALVTANYGWKYLGATQGYQLVSVPGLYAGAGTTFEPGLGYWFWADQDCTLRYPVPGKAPAAAGPSKASRAAATDWLAQLQVSGPGCRDAFNYFGIGETRARLANPPTPVEGSYVDLWFDDPTRGPDQVPLAAGLKPAGRAGSTAWTFHVDTNVADSPLTLSWPDLSAVPTNTTLYLVDTATGKRVYMRTVSAYAFRADGRAPRRFEILAEPRTGASLRISGITAAPTRGGALEIVYSLSQPADVSVRVLSPSGRQVGGAPPTRQASRAGLNRLSWRAVDDDGRALPRGLYMIEIAAQSESGQATKALATLALR